MTVERVARVALPTPFGDFDLHAFECSSGFVYLALVRGDVAGRDAVPTRIHSECLTGDVLGSLRCDCGVQLRTALRTIAARGTGVLVYATGHEGRGIGLIGKLRAYVEQDRGADTVDANLHLGHPADARRYDDAAAVLHRLGVRSIAVLTNNPRKVEALREAGLNVTEVVPLTTAAHARNSRYLRTKRERMGHVDPSGRPPAELARPAIDVGTIVGEVRPRADRPYVVVKYAQSLDGRIATSSGDSRWISGEAERALSHALRASCDAVMVGVGTVLADDPLLTVRLVEGASPRRVVLDSSLRVPLDAAVLDDQADTVVLTTARARALKCTALARAGVAVRRIPASPDGVDMAEALRLLRGDGVRSLLVEGGAQVITSLLRLGLVDRLVVAVAPVVLGRGTEGVGDLGVRQVTDGLQLSNRLVHLVGEDVVITSDVTPGGTGSDAEAADLERASGRAG
jgi:GTP cyclohydrolase II